jgi:hypothetical protein
MSALVAAPSRPRLSPLSALFAELRRDEPRFLALGLIMLFAMAPTLFAAAIDSRAIPGVELWQKAFKFELALLVYLVTLAFFARFLPAGMAAGRRYRVYSDIVVAAIVVEMAWIGGGAALGTLSHFNTTPFGGILYGMMGVAAVLLTSVSMVYAVQIARNPATGLSPAVKESLVVGLGLVLPLTLLTAGTMSSMNVHFVGGAGADAVGLPIMGWARDRGDLRVAHFFATHAMHAIPIAGVVSAWLFGGGARLPVRLFSLAYVALVLATFVQALSGRPFLPGL